MNIGECPYDDCTQTLTLEVPERTPVYERLQCPGCNREIWYRLSRVNPEAWTAEKFESEFVVDPVKRSISRRI